MTGSDNMRESKLWNIEPMCTSDKSRQPVSEKSLDNHWGQGCTGRVDRKKLTVKLSQTDGQVSWSKS